MLKMVIIMMIDEDDDRGDDHNNNDAAANFMLSRYTGTRSRNEPPATLRTEWLERTIAAI